jgi:starch synthase (maltosyl-transferring)
MTPKIYHLHPLVAGKLTDWERHFARIVELGFNYVCVAPPFQPGATGDIFLPADLDRLHPALHWDGSAEAGLGFAASKAAQFGLKLMLDVRLDRIAQASAVRQSHPGWFIGGIENALPDPRRPAPRLDAAYAGFDRTEVANSIAGWWSNVLLHLVREGVAGLRCLAPGRTPPLVWRRVIADLREADPALLCLAWTRGIERAALNGLEGLGFDRVIAPEPSWHRGAASFLEEAEALRRIAPLVGSPEAAFDDRLLSHLPRDTDPRLACRRALRLAAAIGNGVFMPMGFEFATRLAFDAARATPADFERTLWRLPIAWQRSASMALCVP